jgi:hypothetical protein
MERPFYSFRTNWHALPLVRQLLCWIGRHDYEFVSAGEKEYKNRGLLQCFYCGRQKVSTNSSKETTCES